MKNSIGRPGVREVEHQRRVVGDEHVGGQQQLGRVRDSSTRRARSRRRSPAPGRRRSGACGTGSRCRRPTRRAQALEVQVQVQPVAAAAVDDLVAERRRVQHRRAARRGCRAAGAARRPASSRSGARRARRCADSRSRASRPRSRRRAAGSASRSGWARRRTASCARCSSQWLSKRRLVLCIAETSKPSRLSGVPCQVCTHTWSVAAPEPVGEVVVDDDVARPRERLVVLAAALAQPTAPGGHVRLAVRDHPQVLERRAAAHQLLVDRARAVGVLAPAEARVDDGVAQRLGARGRGTTTSRRRRWL